MFLSKHPRVMLPSPLLIRLFVVSANHLSKGHTIQPTSYQPTTSIKGPFYPEHACEIDVDLCHSPPKWFNRFRT